MSNETKPWRGRALVRRKTYEAIADEILMAVQTGELVPGDPVPTERELTEAYQVGRSSVREALRMLESKGLITAEGGNSFVVAKLANPLMVSLRLLVSLQGSTLGDLYELRQMLEGETAALAAERRRPSDLEGMHAAVEALEGNLTTANDPAVLAVTQIDADLAFHLAIAAAAGNPLVASVMDAIRSLLRNALEAVMVRPGSVDSAISAHRAILAAIENGDPEAARTEMLAHLSSVRSQSDAVLVDRI